MKDACPRVTLDGKPLSKHLQFLLNSAAVFTAHFNGQHHITSHRFLFLFLFRFLYRFLFLFLFRFRFRFPLLTFPAAATSFLQLVSNFSLIFHFPLHFSTHFWAVSAPLLLSISYLSSLLFFFVVPIAVAGGQPL